MNNDLAYQIGRLFGPTILAIIIGYVAVRLLKKRNPTPKEWGIILIVAAVIFVLGRLARFVPSAY